MKAAILGSEPEKKFFPKRRTVIMASGKEGRNDQFADFKMVKFND